MAQLEESPLASSHCDIMQYMHSQVKFTGWCGNMNEYQVTAWMKGGICE